MLGLESCMNATIEVAFECAPFARLVAASQTTTPGNAWNYQAWPLVFPQPTATDEEIGTGVIDAFVYAEKTVATLSVVRTEKLDPIVGAMAAFARAVLHSEEKVRGVEAISRQDHYRFAPYGVGNEIVDLRRLFLEFRQVDANAAYAVLDALEHSGAVLCQTVSAQAGSRAEWCGLSVYFPKPGTWTTPHRLANLSAYLQDESELTVFKQASGWHELLKAALAPHLPCDLGHGLR
jgi:hypothetical protein